MGYPRDLDEYTYTELITEIRLREAAVSHGRCSYCHRPFNGEPPCRFLVRHGGEL